MWRTPQDAWEEFKLVPKDRQEEWFLAALKTVYNEGQMDDPPWITNDGREGWVGFE